MSVPTAHTAGHESKHELPVTSSSQPTAESAVQDETLQNVWADGHVGITQDAVGTSALAATTQLVEVEPHVDGSHSHDAVDTDAKEPSVEVRGVLRSPFEQSIEMEASEHLARRAAEMGDHSDVGGLRTPTKEHLPPSPPPPAVPAKDQTAASDASAEQEYDEKHPPVNEDEPVELPEAPRGVKEATGEEIQEIIGQFQQGTNNLEENEIMSPRLERQQSVLVLPPRTSSLENMERHSLSPQSTGGSFSTHDFSLDSSRKTPSLSGISLGKGRSDDTESIASVKASSIYQPPPPAPDPDPVLPFDFHRFLEQLRHRTADPVARFLRSFLNEFGKKSWMVHEQVKIISDFLEFITKKMAQCEVWRTVSDAEFDNAREGMEKLVMNRLYTQTFSPAIPPPMSPRKTVRGARQSSEVANPPGGGRRGQHQEDVERDDVIAQKIRIYSWIREEHLDIKPINDKGRRFLTFAQQELLKINTYRAPRDKVICVLNCCKVIFGFLKNTKSDQSADAFIPLLIYTVLRAQPEHLVSNVQYIWRFRNQEKLGGEAGYYMSSLLGVMTFIENLDRTNLTISDEEFEKEVEHAVSAIAEKNKSDEQEGRSQAALSASPMQRLTEKSALSRPEVTPRNSMDAEQASPRRTASQRLSEKRASSQSGANSESEEVDAVTGLLRSIQKPLNSIGRMFSDDTVTAGTGAGSLRPPGSLTSGTTPRARSPNPRTERSTTPTQTNTLQSQTAKGAEAAARQASVEAAQALNMRAREHAVVVETLQSMFPNLDNEVIHDVVRAQEGNVGRAVDACLAMSGSGT